MRDRSGDKGRETVDRILGAAKDVFAEKGFAGARVEEIAGRAGVNKATLYYHIGDKKALYAEVIHDVIGNAARRLSSGIEAAKSPEDKVRTYIRTLLETFDENPQMPRLMMRELASGGQSLPEVFFEDLFSIFRTLSWIIEEGREQGVFIETLPLIVHFMAIGTAVIYKTIIPVLLASGQVPDELRCHAGDMSGPVSREVEKLILKAMRT